MYAKYGDYPHAAGEVWLQSMRKDGLFVNGMSRGYMQSMQLAGQLHAADPSALTAAMATLTDAYRRQGLDFGIYEDDHTPTAVLLLSSNCLGGTRVTQLPSFGEVKQGEYTTWVRYSFAIEGEVIDTNCPLLAWEETVEFWGGGPEIVFLECTTGPPQKQQTKEQTTFYATQVGSAVGHIARPQPPSPIWPEHWLRPPSGGGLILPERLGAVGAPVYRGFPIRWHYHFASATPFYGAPTPWPA